MHLLSDTRRRGSTDQQTTPHCTHHIEDSSQRASDIVESNAQVLERQVVECDHAHKNDRQRHDLQTYTHTHTHTHTERDKRHCLLVTVIMI